MSTSRPPNVTGDGTPGYMDLDYHERLLKEALLLMETGRIDKARLSVSNALAHTRHYTVRRPAYRCRA